MMREHDTMRHLLPGNTIRTDSEIDLFARLLHDHIRFEERELFPHIEKKLTQSELNEIASKLNHTSACPAKWNNEFWKD
jgi:hemerythrin-like domain-containing protein